MEKLAEEYVQIVDAIAEHLQSSDVLTEYLNEEEEELYKSLVDTYEPEIENLYNSVAENDPLQIISLEQMLIEDRFEGLFIPKLLGYAVLRGIVNEDYKYLRSQDQFGDIIMTILNSPNFEMIKSRVGQGIEIGFALSSDIWITNLVKQVTLKRAKGFINNHKKHEYRDSAVREKAYKRYANQFRDDNFYTAEFPTNAAELQIEYPQLKKFLVERITRNLPQESLQQYITDFVSSAELPGTTEYVYIFGLIVNYFDLDEKGTKVLKKRLNTERVEINRFNEKYFDFLLELLESRLEVDVDNDRRVSKLLDMTIKDDLTAYYQLMDTVHSKGYIHVDTQEEIRKFYYNHEGLSTVNECVRQTILEYFGLILLHLETDEFQDYFDLNKIFTTYINIFDNQKFNQAVKNLSLVYIKKLLKTYTNKRGKDYQGIKKFVTTTFLDHGFMNQKELKELFKTKRKKKVKKEEA